MNQVLPVEQMPQALLAARHAGGGRSAPRDGVIVPAAASTGLDKILSQVRVSSGHDFSLYKKSTIGRRIERRMAVCRIDDADAYVRHAQENPEELKHLFRELLINVTSFFRDAEAFEVLKAKVLPGLMQRRAEGSVLRIWVAGCATGEEVYSVAMVVREWMDESRHECKVQLYGTDLDDDAIRVARAGLYPPNIAQDLSPERLRRFFTKDDGGYRVRKEIREMAVFAVQSVIKGGGCVVGTLVRPEEQSQYAMLGCNLASCRIDTFYNPIIGTNNLCKINTTYSDTKLDICPKSYKILRAWTILDWCSGLLKTGHQVIKVVDSKGPIVTIPPDVTTAVEACVAAVNDNNTTGVTTANVSAVINADPYTCTGRWIASLPTIVFDCNTVTYEVEFALAEANGLPAATPNYTKSSGQTRSTRLANGRWELTVHLPSGSIAGSFTYTNSVDEIYDIQVIPNKIRPNILNTLTNDHKGALSIPGATYWAAINNLNE